MNVRLQLAVCVVLSLLSGNAHAQPMRPADDTFVLLKLDSVPTGEKQTRRALQEKLSANPKDAPTAIAVARAAITAGRNQGDPRLYGQAQAALDPWWDDQNAPIDIVILRATVLQAFHDFKPALSDLDLVIAIAPDNMQARLSRAFINMVTGNHQRAAEDCAAIANPRAILVRDICRTRLAALTGKGREAFTQLQHSVENVPGGNATALAFAQTVLAEIAVSLGDIKTAETLFTQLTNTSNPDVAILAAHADLLLASDRAAEALALLENRGESDALLLRRAIAAKKTADSRLANWLSVLQDRFAAAAASNNRVHLREEARFTLEVLGDAKAALALASENWSTQKEPADAQLFLAAALASGDPSAAKPVLDFVAQTALNDSRLTPLLQKLAAP